QCVCMSLSALVYAHMQGKNNPPRNWTTEDLDWILLYGNKAYAQTIAYLIKEKNQLDSLIHAKFYLNEDQIKTDLVLFQHQVHLKVHTGLYGYLHQKGIFKSLDQRLDTCFIQRRHHFAVIISN